MYKKILIASDAHNEYRPLILKEAYDLLEEEFGVSVAKQLTEENPKKLLSNEEIRVEYQEIERKKKRFLWF
ncbi:hypothetical protein [Holdemania massiliensis]|uniref:hypothetical protein n=1 Tax=Holdemania massiliensis TaxID=1468449 RepID=UPI00351F9153